MKNIDISLLRSWGSKLQENPRLLMAIVAVVLILDVGFVLRAQVTGIGRMWQRARQVKADIIASRSDSKNTMNYQDRLSSLKAEEVELSGKITLQGQLPQVLEAISKFADIAGVRILRIKPLDEKPGTTSAGKAAAAAGYTRPKISIAGKGNFQQLIRFVTQVESGPIFMDIQSFEIRTDDQEYGKEVVTIVLDVVARKV